MQTFTCYTLVDITHTGVIRDTAELELERNQQRNWETILQCIGLMTQPMNLQLPPGPIEHADLKYFDFGEMYTGEHRVWTFKFSIDHDDIFADDHSDLGRLNNAVDQVPVVTYLSETARFMLPILHTSGAIKNIYFKSAKFE